MNGSITPDLEVNGPADHAPVFYFLEIIFFFFRLLREKHCRDEEFAEICKLRQSAALHTIDSLLDLPVSVNFFNYILLLKCKF